MLHLSPKLPRQTAHQVLCICRKNMQRYVGISRPRSKDTVSTKGFAKPGLSLSRENIYNAAYSALGSSAAASGFGSSAGGASAWPEAAGASASEEVQRVCGTLAHGPIAKFNAHKDVPSCHGEAA